MSAAKLHRPSYPRLMDFEFEGEIWYWRGPSPFHFVTVPEGPAAEIARVAGEVTYGWGMIPAAVTIGRTRLTTALWPKDGTYIVPIKAATRKAEKIDLGDVVHIGLEIGVRPGG